MLYRVTGTLWSWDEPISVLVEADSEEHAEWAALEAVAGSPLDMLSDQWMFEDGPIVEPAPPAVENELAGAPTLFDLEQFGPGPKVLGHYVVGA